MADKPKHASEYKSEQVDLVRAMCLYVATKLGDMMDDLLIIGGLVPSLIIDQEHLGEDVEPHVGTMDLDVGLQVALLKEGRYRQLTERLRDAGFEMDKNVAGNPTRQRWAISSARGVTIDFLIQPTLEGDKAGKLRDLEPDFAAIIAPGLRCAFQDRKQVTLKGTTLFGEKATRDIWVCDAGAYVVLKALAFDSRGENKDAYDLYYVVRNYGGGPADVASKVQPLLDDADAQRALTVLKRDFSEPDSVGPMRVAAFVSGGKDDDLQADVVGFVRQLLTAMTDDLDLATAARELNVGVDYLETQMASGRLRDVGVDGARRIRRDDLTSFKATRDAERREGLRDLTSLTEDFGGYERERSG